MICFTLRLIFTCHFPHRSATRLNHLDDHGHHQNLRRRRRRRQRHTHDPLPDWPRPPCKLYVRMSKLDPFCHGVTPGLWYKLICFRAFFLPTWGLQPVWTRFAKFVVSHCRYSWYIPPLLLTAPVILPVAFGPVSILKLNHLSLFIEYHQRILAVILTLISFNVFSGFVGSFSPSLIPSIWRTLDAWQSNLIEDNVVSHVLPRFKCFHNAVRTGLAHTFYPIQNYPRFSNLEGRKRRDS